MSRWCQITAGKLSVCLWPRALSLSAYLRWLPLISSPRVKISESIPASVSPSLPETRRATTPLANYCTWHPWPAAAWTGPAWARLTIGGRGVARVSLIGRVHAACGANNHTPPAANYRGGGRGPVGGLSDSQQPLAMSYRPLDDCECWSSW